MTRSAKFKLMLFVWGCSNLCQFTWADVVQWPKSLVVITSDQRAVLEVEGPSVGSGDSSPDIQIFNLDAVADVEVRLSEGLSADPVQARAMVEQHIARIGYSALEAELRDAYQALRLRLLWRFTSMRSAFC